MSRVSQRIVDKVAGQLAVSLLLDEQGLVATLGPCSEISSCRQPILIPQSATGMAPIDNATDALSGARVVAIFRATFILLTRSFGALWLLAATACSHETLHVQLTATRASEPTEPATTLLVSFPSGDLSLRGKLQLPKRGKSERVPAVVILAGSGPMPMDCAPPGQAGMRFPAPVPLCADLADTLSDIGVASLRYDKRSCGRFNKCADNDYPLPPATLTIDAFLADARAAIAALRQQPEVDPYAVFVLGHSQGAAFVPILLSDDPHLLGGVLLAGAYRDIDALLSEQAELVGALMLKTGAGEAGASAVTAPILDAVRSIQGLRAGRETTADILGTPAMFWKSWLALSDQSRRTAPQVPQRMLLIVGEFDFNVPTTELELWRAALDGSRRGHLFERLPCVTHAMNCVRQTNLAALRPSDVAPHIAHAVRERIQRYVVQVVADARARSPSEAAFRHRRHGQHHEVPRRESETADQFGRSRSRAVRPRTDRSGPRPIHSRLAT